MYRPIGCYIQFVFIEKIAYIILSFELCGDSLTLSGPVRAPGCKNGPAPFPDQMSYKVTKPGLVSVLYLSMFFIVLVFIRAPFYVLLVFIVCVLSFGCCT